MSNQLVRAKITNVDRDGNATVTFKIDMDEYVKKGFVEAWVMPVDSRSISDKQRRCCWSLVEAISEEVGEFREEMNTHLKYDFLKWRAEKIGQNLETFFSLSNAPMDLINEYQRYLVEFIMRFDIPTKFSLLEFIDDDGYESYIYNCLKHKKCCICGRYADLHHVDRVGMGNNRDEILHEGLEALPVCRSHHQEIDNMGDTAFYQLYHLKGGVKLTKELCKIYRLKTKKEVKE